MIFNKKNKIKKHAYKIDKLVTSLIIWWALASFIWLSKKNQKKSIWKNISDKSSNVAKKSISLFWKVLVWILKIFSKKK